MTASVGPTNGERRRAGQAAATSAIVSGATMNASKRCVHSHKVPSVMRGIMRPWQSGQSGHVSPAPLMRVQLPSTTVIRATKSVARRKAEESFHPSLSVASRRPDGNDK